MVAGWFQGCSECVCAGRGLRLQQTGELSFYLSIYLICLCIYVPPKLCADSYGVWKPYERSEDIRFSLLLACLSSSPLKVKVAAACYRFTMLSAFRVIFTLCGSFACFSDVAGLITAFHPVFLWPLSGKRVCLSSRSAHPCGQLVGVVLTGAVLCEQQQVTVPSWVSFERTVAGFLVMLLFES